MSAHIDDRPGSGLGWADPAAGAFTVEQSCAEDTASLRQAVLRPQRTIEQMAVPGDDNPETAYLAVRAASRDAAIVACVRIQPVPCPWPGQLEVPAHSAWQLRAMATDPSVRGRGLGRMLVAAATDHVAARAGDLIWCNARVSAEGFYLGQGFRTVTDRFHVHEVAEEHVGMVRSLAGPEQHRGAGTT